MVYGRRSKVITFLSEFLLPDATGSNYVNNDSKFYDFSVSTHFKKSIGKGYLQNENENYIFTWDSYIIINNFKHMDY
jgi:hypothetical protein